VEHKQIVIIGASAAGVSAAEAVVEAGGGRAVGLLLIGAEQRLPYKRTKVSKTFAAGFEPEAFALRERAWFAEHGVKLASGRTVTAIDIEGHTLRLDDNKEVAWERLVLATGAESNRLGLDEEVDEAVHQAHDIAGVEALRRSALGAQTALVVGMGVMGVEVAEQLARMGKQVTLVGDSAELMSGELNAPARRRLAGLLEQSGVRLRYEASVERVERVGVGAGAGLRVVLEGGSVERVDMAVSCIGMRPNTALARAAGLSVERGVVVDAQLRTSHPDVYAAGDLAQHPDGRVTHLWRHALHQGRVAGGNAAGGAEGYAFVPFRLKCEVFGGYFFSLGLPAAAELQRYEVVEHAGAARYLCGYYREGRLAGLVMCDDKANQRAYNQAVVEGWQRGVFERAFL
jgi:3-phenylpropionate/trans-cinnamate dioxygenase ferredoxin reductase component